MGSGVLVQILIDLLLISGFAFVWVKLHRPQKDDPRLSRGLQLLQSKIAVLEDLSDQVEKQVQQISQLIEVKLKEVQSQLQEADRQIARIDGSMKKSLEVAEIFQDKIPHQEIVERQNVIKYVQAARLAHQGRSIDEIIEQTDLTRGEVEMIAQVNRNQLQFSEDDLPEWVKGASTGPSRKFDADLESQLVAHPRDHANLSLSSLGEQFRKALPVEPAAPIERNPSIPLVEMPERKVTATMPAAPATQSLGRAGLVKSTTKIEAETSSGKKVEVQKVLFPRIDLNEHLS